MEVRRLIKFGDSSHVVSIPKSWIKENKLKKGDLIFIDKNGNGELILMSKEKDEKKKDKKIIIDVNDKDLSQINKELISAYTNNYSEIVLNGKISKLNELKELISYKIGLNMVEKNHNEIVIKDLLDPKTISLEKTIKRMDNLIRILFTNLKDGLNKPVFCDNSCKEIYEIDGEVNRVYFLVLKLIKKSINDPTLLKHLEINQEKILDVYWLIMNFEHIGDEIKRVAKFLSEKKMGGPMKEKLTDVICSIEKNYLDTISAHLSYDKKFAIEICSRKDRIIKKCDDLLSNSHNFTIYQIAERLKILEAAVHNISKFVAY